MRPFYEQQRPAWILHQKKLDFPLHLHNAVEIVYVLEGSSTVLCDSGRLVLRPGDFFVSFPNQAHGYEDSRDFEGYVLIATTASLPTFKATLEQKQPAEPVFHPTGQAVEDIVTLMKMMRADRNTAPPSSLQGYALVLFNKVVNMLQLAPRSASTDTLQVILRYISEHYREPITRKGIAKAIGYSESHISHLFTEVLNVSLTDYITLLRLDDARQLLRDTDLPVSRIAMMLGFASIRSFNRFFAKEMKMSPTAYRALRR